MPDPDLAEPSERDGRATALWGSAVVLAVAATAVLVISDDSRLLKLGLAAALWAALVGAFGVSKLRSRVAEEDERAEELQRVYELELEREVEARREFEAETENEVRRKVAEESRKEVEALRAELRTLRESLERIMGGDVLFERVALRAESTRVRSLTEAGQQRPDPRVIQQPTEHRGRQLPSGNPVAEANTELMNRLAGEPPPQQRRPPRPTQQGQNRPPRNQYVRPAGHTPPGNESSKQATPKERPAAKQRAAQQRPAAQQKPKERPAPKEQLAANQKPPAQEKSDERPAPIGRTQAREAPAPKETTEAPEQPETPSRDTGAHAEGTSVIDLLAAYGASTESRKHRRRRE